jgi:arsenate reductase
MTVAIYHNPECGTSRNTLAMIRQSGAEPEVVEYLTAPPSAQTLRRLLDAMGKTPREVLRTNVPPYAELGLAGSAHTGDELIGLMVRNPLLINRPIVETPRGVRLCRPSEVVLEILPNPHIGRFVKEDGEVIDAAEPRA